MTTPETEILQRRAAQAAQAARQAAGQLADFGSSCSALARKHADRAAGSASAAWDVYSAAPAKHKALVAGGIACGVGIIAAGIAHLVHYRKTAAAYRMLRRYEADALADEAAVAQVLDQALLVLDASALDAVGDAADALEAPGCIAILSFEDDADDEELLNYSESYVGAGKDMLACAKRQLAGEGNLYVQADAQYGRPMKVLFFPCEYHKVYDQREQLIDTLGSWCSYNRVSDVDLVD